MKFLRIGNIGEEKPAFLDKNGDIRDLSAHITDFNSETLNLHTLHKLEKVSKITKCNILGKAEFLNPGQSVKDRAALYIIKDAIKKKKLKKNGIIVEGTAGNTGIGLTLVGNSFGLKSVIIMPKTQSEEKKKRIKNLWC